MRHIAILLSLFALVCITPSCESTKAPPAEEMMAAENTNCPMNPGETADPSVTTDFEGHTVAFCCSRCEGKFEDLPRDQKVQKLQAVGIAVE